MPAMKNPFRLLYLFLLFSFVAAAACKRETILQQQPPPTPMPATEKKYELVWSDEFDYAGLPDAMKWGYDVGGQGWGNNELEYYTKSRPENARVEGGSLVIEARKEKF